MLGCSGNAGRVGARPRTRPCGWSAALENWPHSRSRRRWRVTSSRWFAPSAYCALRPGLLAAGPACAPPYSSWPRVADSPPDIERRRAKQALAYVAASARLSAVATGQTTKRRRGVATPDHNAELWAHIEPDSSRLL